MFSQSITSAVRSAWSIFSIEPYAKAKAMDPWKSVYSRIRGFFPENVDKNHSISARMPIVTLQKATLAEEGDHLFLTLDSGDIVYLPIEEDFYSLKEYLGKQNVNVWEIEDLRSDETLYFLKREKENFCDEKDDWSSVCTTLIEQQERPFFKVKDLSDNTEKYLFSRGPGQGTDYVDYNNLAQYCANPKTADCFLWFQGKPWHLPQGKTWHTQTALLGCAISLLLHRNGQMPIAASALQTIGMSTWAFPMALLDFASGANTPPTVVNPINDIYVDPGQNVSFGLNGVFQDLDGDTLAYTVTGLPPGVSLSGPAHPFLGDIPIQKRETIFFEVQGDLVHVFETSPTGTTEYETWDISNLSAATSLSFYTDSSSESSDAKIFEGYAYLAGGGANIRIVNATNPSNLTFVAEFTGEQPSSRLHFDPIRKLLLFGQAGNLVIVNVTQPEQPIFLNKLGTGSAITDVAITEDFVGITSSYGSFTFLNLTDIFSVSKELTNPLFGSNTIHKMIERDRIVFAFANPIQVGPNFSIFRHTGLSDTEVTFFAGSRDDVYSDPFLSGPYVFFTTDFGTANNYRQVFHDVRDVDQVQQRLPFLDTTFIKIFVQGNRFFGLYDTGQNSRKNIAVYGINHLHYSGIPQVTGQAFPITVTADDGRENGRTTTTFALFVRDNTLGVPTLPPTPPPSPSPTSSTAVSTTVLPSTPPGPAGVSSAPQSATVSLFWTSLGLTGLAMRNHL